MPIADEIYDRLVAQLGSTIDAVYDTVRPDGLTLGDNPVVVYQFIGTNPDTLLNGDIALEYSSLQVSVQCSLFALSAARAVRAAVIAALHMFRSTSFEVCQWVTTYPESWPTAEIPEYNLPAEFKITA